MEKAQIELDAMKKKWQQEQEKHQKALDEA